MYFRYSIIVLIALCSLLSVAVSDFIPHKKYLFWKVSFYFGTYAFTASIVKCCLGHQKETLIGSFWNMGLMTIVHYGIPLCIMALVLPIALKWVLKKAGEGIIGVIRYFDSSLFFTLSLAFILVRKINNGIYCTAFALASAMTLTAILLKKTDGEYVRRGGIKSKTLAATPVLLYYTVTVVIYTPNELYINNASDFSMSYWYFFGKLLFAGVFVTAVLMAGVVLYLNQSHMNLYMALMFALLTAGYIQGMFLNGNMGILDGTENNAYSKLETYINMGIWIAIAAAVIMFSVKKSSTAQKLMKVISIWIILIQTVSLGVIVITSKETAPKSEMALTTKGMLDVGEKNNVIVFVLDKFDGSYVEEIIEDTPDFFDPLNDFTDYENAMSMFCPTGKSIPFLLTGTEYKDGETGYTQYAYGNDTLLKDMSDAGYNVGVYTDKRFVDEKMKDIISNYEEGIKRKCSTSALFALMTQCSRYKMAPFAAKRYYVYDTSDIALLVADGGIVNIENDIPFYRGLTEEGLRVSAEESEGTYRFIHMHGAHPPYTMTEDFQYVEYDYKRDDGYGVINISQWKGAMKIVYEYMRQLKELGKYDGSLIIITADHGLTSGLSDANGNMVGISYPILFVKQPYEKHEKMAVSDAPVCHADALETLREYVGISTSARTLDEIGNDEARVRHMIVSTPSTVDKYEVNGDVRFIENWRLVSK